MIALSNTHHGKENVKAMILPKLPVVAGPVPRKTTCPWPTTDPVCPFDGKRKGTCASLRKVKHIYIYIYERYAEEIC